MADTSFTAQQTTILAAWLNQVNLAVFQGRSPNMGTTTGSANAQVLTLATGSLYTSRTAGDTFGFVAGYSNSSAATLQIVAPSGSLAAAALELNGAALTGGEVIAGQPYVVSWDGTAWQLISLAGTAYGTTLLQAASAAAARTVLGAAASANTTLTGNLSLAGDITPSQITAQQNDYAPSGIAGAVVLRLSSNASQNITGFDAIGDGRLLIHENVGNQPLTLVRESSGSTANMRITVGANVALSEADVALTLYDSTLERHRVIAQPANGAFRSVQVFTTTGANTWTKPAGLKRVKVTVVGAGGGAGGAPATGGGQCSVGSGGAAGGTAIKTIAAASLGATETATVGAKGTGGLGAAGSTGGTSSFGAHCSATGGSGGAAGGPVANDFFIGNGITGGVGSGGDINITGGPGGIGGALLNRSEMGGVGGDSTHGGGAAAQINNSAGRNAAATAYGAGGGGAACDSSTGPYSGGNGADGIIIVEEFF